MEKLKDINYLNSLNKYKTGLTLLSNGINVKNLDPLLESTTDKLCELGKVLPFHWDLDSYSVNEEN